MSYAAIRDSNVRTWNAAGSLTKLSLQEVCEKFGVDLESDRMSRFFWEMHSRKRIFLTEDLLDWLGICSSPQEPYEHKRAVVTDLLARNPHVSFSEMNDRRESQRKHYVMNPPDFESLVMQMPHTGKVVELRKLFSLAKLLVAKYCEYEKYYDRVCARQSAAATETRIQKELARAEGERQRAAAERRRVREELSRAETARRAAENELSRAREDVQRNNPTPLNRMRRYCLGLYVGGDGDYHLLQRDSEGYRAAERKLLDREMTTVRVWLDVPPDTAHALRKKCRQMHWHARYNTIRVSNRRDLIKAIEEIIVV